MQLTYDSNDNDNNGANKNMPVAQARNPKHMRYLEKTTNVNDKCVALLNSKLSGDNGGIKVKANRADTQKHHVGFRAFIKCLNVYAVKSLLTYMMPFEEILLVGETIYN